MKALLGFFFAVGFAFCLRAPASAACSYPNTLSNGQIVDANGLNANLTAISLCVTNLQPSGIVPTSTFNATFGGSLPYTFPAGLNVTGITTSSTVNSANFVSGTTTITPGSATFAGNASVAGSLSAASFTDSALASGLCVQTTTGGLLATAAGPCYVSNVTKYTVTATLGATCPGYQNCPSTTSTGLPTGSPTTTGVCYPMENGGVTGAIGIISYNASSYFFNVFNATAGNIPSGTSVVFNVTCQ